MSEALRTTKKGLNKYGLYEQAFDLPGYCVITVFNPRVQAECTSTKSPAGNLSRYTYAHNSSGSDY
ncbi:MAG: hypothetical protein WAK31_03530 [Chthoniobacterales bacterium]